MCTFRYLIDTVPSLMLRHVLLLTDFVTLLDNIFQIINAYLLKSFVVKISQVPFYVVIF